MLKHSLPGILLCLALKCFSQEAATTARPLSIGDSIPHDLVLSDVYNYPVSKIRLSDLKGKFIILDFWATWCGACIATFPKMHQLQARFGDNLQVILVNTYQGVKSGESDPLFSAQRGPFFSVQIDPLYSVETDPLLDNGLDWL